MNREELLTFHAEFTLKMEDICEKKNADYAGSVACPFANFTRVEMLGFATAEQGFLTRMMDKFCRISSFVKNGTLMVKDESVTDTLLDLANYCVLMAAYLQHKKDLTG